MVLNVFDSDAQCGYNRNFDSAGPNPNDSDTPVGILTWNSTDIKNLVNRVDKLDMHTFGAQNIKYRYWRLTNLVERKITGGCQNWPGIFRPGQLESFEFHHQGKLYWNGQTVEVDDCISDTIPIVSAEKDNDPDITYPGTSWTIKFDLGAKYAVTSITQRTDPNYALLRYGTAITPYEIFKSFTVEARNSESEDWEYICRFEDIPNPRENSGNVPFVERFGVRSPHCVIIRPPAEKAVFPSDHNDLHEITRKEAYRWTISDFLIEDDEGNELPNSVANPVARFFANGTLYKEGNQHNVGEDVTRKITKQDAVTQTQASSSQLYGYVNIDNPSTDIYFDRLNPVALTSIQFALRRSDAKILSVRVVGYDQCDDIVTDVTFDSDFLRTELVNPGVRSVAQVGGIESWSDHYILLETAKDDGAVFPGDATRMWPAPPGGGDALWEWDTTIRTSSFTAEVGKYYFAKLINNTDIDVTLPSSAVVGDVVLIRGIYSQFLSSNISIETAMGSGQNIEDQLSGPVTLDEGFNEPHVGLILLDDNGTDTWYVFLGGLAGISS